MAQHCQFFVLKAFRRAREALASVSSTVVHETAIGAVMLGTVTLAVEAARLEGGAHEPEHDGIVVEEERPGPPAGRRIHALATMRAPCLFSARGDAGIAERRRRDRNPWRLFTL